LSWWLWRMHSSFLGLIKTRWVRFLQWVISCPAKGLLTRNTNLVSYIKKKEVISLGWWSGAYLRGLTLPRDLRQRGTLGGPQKKKKKVSYICTAQIWTASVCIVLRTRSHRQHKMFGSRDTKFAFCVNTPWAADFQTIDSRSDGHRHWSNVMSGFI
jgi:hypothetical protein